MRVLTLSASEEPRLPKGNYDMWAGELRLYDPEWLPLDESMAAFARAYRGASETVQRQTRASLSASDGDRCLAFARRAAVFAMRRQDEQVVADGLGACVVLDVGLVDERDVLVALALLHHAAERIGADAAAMLQAAAVAATPDVAALIDGFLARPAHERSLRDAWGKVEVQAPGGLGLLDWGFRPWLPTLDLAELGVRIAAAISAADYQADDPILAVEMPEIWLREADDPSLGSILGSARGTVRVQGYLRPTAGPAHSRQQLTIWIVEAPDEAAASRLTAMARHGRQGAAMLGVSGGAAFVLVVARSFMLGEEVYESTASLNRLEPPLMNILVDAQTSNGTGISSNTSTA